VHIGQFRVGDTVQKILAKGRSDMKFKEWNYQEWLEVAGADFFGLNWLCANLF